MPSGRSPIRLRSQLLAEPGQPVLQPRRLDPLERHPVHAWRALAFPLPRWTDPGASVGCFPRSCCLPRTPGGSASTTSLSRPAQASLALPPVDSLRRPRRRLSQGFDTAGCPTAPPASYRANRPLPGWDLHPQGDRALRGAPEFQREGKLRFAQGAYARLRSEAPIKVRSVNSVCTQ